MNDGDDGKSGPKTVKRYVKDFPAGLQLLGIFFKTRKK